MLHLTVTPRFFLDRPFRDDETRHLRLLPQRAERPRPQRVAERVHHAQHRVRGLDPADGQRLPQRGARAAGGGHGVGHEA